MCKQFLFLGVGGMGMAPLAFYVRQMGHIVYGFDDRLSTDLERLFEGQKIIICERFPEKIDGVIFSSALATHHPWLTMAEERGISAVRRGNFLAEFCEKKKVIAITGSHGKTTTTAMLTDHLPGCDYILGGFFECENKPPAFYRESNPYLICEVDESDRTIESFRPYITAALNLEDDHLRAYGSPKHLDTAFEKLFSQTRKAIIIPETDCRLNAIARKLAAPPGFIHTVPPPKNDYGEQCGENIAIVGKILEILALEPDKPPIVAPVSYTPIFRRNQYLGRIDGDKRAVEIWTDYAHHPTEIENYIARFQKLHPNKKILLIFQPHRYSRTQQYARDLAEIFAARDALLLPVYPADETFSADGTTQAILRYLPQTTKAKFLESLENFSLRTFFPADDSPDTVLFIGAGDIFQRAQRWIMGQRISDLRAHLTRRSIAFRENFPLKTHNTLQIDATVPLWVEPQSEGELRELIRQLRTAGIPYRAIGHGANLLLDECEGVFISLRKMPVSWVIDRGTLTASANIPLATFVGRLAALGFPGYEALMGIPGTLGGALYMNAGAQGQSIFDHLRSLKFLDSSGEIGVISKGEIRFGYRHGFRRGIILGAQFSLERRESAAILLEKIRAQARWRRGKQPSQPNAGSIFKNPENHFAGALIEQTGLKGVGIGGAKIAETHANFIVNGRKTATAGDIKRLLRLARQSVFEKHGIFLEREILLASDKFLPII
ncbi:MAG: UDP-N-acetylmuramate dehydrogenase [Puniceicoccales bacterium]|jgi:UDP-N-acetylenolpyruvoylglucosamine reductase|nr:UDP-N-acetylmuramate dehydrogenase [Puniceicoccales bacterium]